MDCEVGKEGIIMAIAGVAQSQYMDPQPAMYVAPQVSKDIEKKVFAGSNAKDSSGVAKEQKSISQINGYDQGVRNGVDGQNVIRTADSALKSMYDNLMRIRELGIKASSSALYTDEDRRQMQIEVSQLKQSISGISKDTQFNTQKLLDGSMADMHLALNPKGGGMDIKMEDVTLEELGIKDFDVTGKFDLKSIDDAMQKVSDARSLLGAQSSALSHSISIAEESSLNETESLSSLEDLDVEGVVSERKKQEILEQYQYFGIQEKAQDQENMVKTLLS